MSTTVTATEALQTTLAAEHAAVFVLGAVGARVSRSTQPALHAAVLAAYDVHRTRRDELVAVLGTAGESPVPARPGYLLPDLATPGSTATAALAVEQRAAATYAHLVATTVGEQRSWALDALLDAAVRELTFGSAPQQLPGL